MRETQSGKEKEYLFGKLFGWGATWRNSEGELPSYTDHPMPTLTT